MIVCCAHPKQQNFDDIKPSTKVNTLIQFSESFPEGLLCDRAWTDNGFVDHFWYKGSPGVPKDKVEIKKMTLLEYLKEYFKNGINPANPFQAQAEKKWLDIWEEKYGSINIPKNIPERNKESGFITETIIDHLLDIQKDYLNDKKPNNYLKRKNK